MKGFQLVGIVFVIGLAPATVLRRAFAEEPNGHLYKSMRCTINREITKYLLMDLIQENGGVWRGDPSDNEIALYG